MIVLLSGCSTMPKPDMVSADQRLRLWSQHQSIHARISGWSLKGKVGIRSGSKGSSVTLNWSYASTGQNIELYGPFGGGRILIESSPTFAVLRDVGGRVIHGQSAEQVLYERLGWHIPFDEMTRWSRGLPGEGANDLKINASGRLMSFNQGIWHIEYTQYQPILKFSLPRKFTITSLPGKLEVFDEDGHYLGDELQVRVVLKSWHDIQSVQS